MVLLFWPTPWLAHDSWHIQDWFEVFKERKKTTSLLSFPLVHYLGRQEDFWDTFLVQTKQKENSAFFFSIFWCYTISKFVLQVGNIPSLDIWGFLRFVLGDLVYFCEVFSSCNLHLGVFVRLMPFGHFVNSFGDSGRN